MCTLDFVYLSILTALLYRSAAVLCFRQYKQCLDQSTVQLCSSDNALSGQQSVYDGDGTTGPSHVKRTVERQNEGKIFGTPFYLMLGNTLPPTKTSLIHIM